MAEQTTNGASSGAQSPFATVTTEVVTQMARSAAGELVKGQQPLSTVARTVVGEAAQTLEKRAPKAVEDAGILNWRYAALGWITWEVGKRVISRKAKAAIGKSTKGASSGGSGTRNGGGTDA